MQKIKKIYRSSYDGESVVTNMTYSEGQWSLEREQVANAVVNNQISGKAIVFGNGVSRQGLNMAAIAKHRGGLLASGALQTYGCNALYRDFAPHFLVANGKEIISEIADSNYTNEHIVYANATAILNHPGKFYLIPQDPSWNAGAIATYIACFDGHKTVYLAGFDGVDDPTSGYNIYQGTNAYPVPEYGYSEEFWTQTMLEIFNTYNDVDFVRVVPEEQFRMPEAWRYVVNLRQITFNQFAVEVDL